MRVGEWPATAPVERDRRASDGAPAGAAWWGRAVVVIAVLAAVFTLVVNGDGLTAEGLSRNWQLLDPGALADDPLGSIWHLHTQPPLHNLLVGVVGWLPLPPAGTLFLLYAGALLATGLLLHDLLVRWGTPPLAAGLLTGVAMVNPALLASLSVAGYEVPVALLVVAALWAFQRHLDAPSLPVLLALSGLLTAAVLTRSLLHPLWAAALLALALVARPASRRRAAAALAIPLVLVGGWALKNQLVFGSPTLSTSSGFDLQRGIVGPLPADAVRAARADGAVSPLALRYPWGSLDYYGDDRAGTGECTPGHDHPVTLEVAKAVGDDGRTVPNFNNECYLPLYRRARADALALVRRYPARYLATRDSGLVLSYNTARGCFSEPCTWMDRLYQPLLVKLDGEVTMADWNLRLFEDGEETLDVTLSMVLVAASGAVAWRGLVAAWRLRRAGWSAAARREWPTDELLWLAAAATVVVVVGVGALVGFGDNDRVRTTIDPLLLTLPAAAAVRSLANAARSPAPERDDKGDRAEVATDGGSPGGDAPRPLDHLAP